MKLVDADLRLHEKNVAEEGGVAFIRRELKKQAQEAIKDEAIRAGQYYVNHRWLGGTLTNWDTIQKTYCSLENQCNGRRRHFRSFT